MAHLHNDSIMTHLHNDSIMTHLHNDSMNDSLTDWIVRVTLAPTDHVDPSTPAADTAETISGSFVSVREAAKKVLFKWTVH